MSRILKIYPLKLLTSINYVLTKIIVLLSIDIFKEFKIVKCFDKNKMLSDVKIISYIYVQTLSMQNKQIIHRSYLYKNWKIDS